MEKTRLQRFVYGLGLAVSVTCVLYVLYQIYDERIWDADTGVLLRLGGAVLVGAAVYAISSIMLSLAWHDALGWLGEQVLARRSTLAIYGRAQLAKYIPGNVFSIVSRHALGRRAGFSHRGLAWAAFLEIVGMIYAASIVAVAGAGAWSSETLGVPIFTIVMGGAVLLLAPLILTHALARFSFTSRLVLPKMSASAYLRLFGVFLLYVPFFTVSGLVFAFFVHCVSPEVGLGWIELAGIASAVWIVGYVTPGASGGIGVRDALLLLALEAPIGAAGAGLVVLAYRFMTTLGDVGFFALASTIQLPTQIGSASTDNREEANPVRSIP